MSEVPVFLSFVGRAGACYSIKVGVLLLGDRIIDVNLNTACHSNSTLDTGDYQLADSTWRSTVTICRAHVTHHRRGELPWNEKSY